jgi:predicted RNase H-like HicB family nuclease
MTPIRVLYHHESESWWAESPDVEGWSAAGDSYEEVRELAEEGIRFALDRGDVDLEHFLPADDRDVAVTA